MWDAWVIGENVSLHMRPGWGQLHWEVNRGTQTPGCALGPLGIPLSSSGRDTATACIPVTRMICSFVYKEKCQTPEKIPRTMIVTHDKTEHVKFFSGAFGRGC